MSGVAEISPKYLAEVASNAIRSGYKQTEVGVIPEDWCVKRLKDISPSQSVGLVINPSSYYSERGSVPMLVGSHVSENKIDWSSSNRITLESNAKLPSSRLNAGDLVTVRVGAPGVTAVIPPELDQANCASMMIIRKGEKFDSHWLCFLMNSSIGKQRIEGVQYGTAQKQFNIIDAVDFLFPYPPIKEQTVIASALSDVDGLIGELQKLIAKKQAIKTAIMQQLLTGRTRLPQFTHHPDGTPKGTKQTELGQIPEDWEVVNIGELGQVDPENLGATTSPDYEFNYVSLEQIEKGVLLGTIRTIFRNAPSRARRVLKKGDILVSTVRPNLMSHYFVQHEVKDLICSTGFSVIRSFEVKLCPGYLYQQLFSSVINNQIEMLISGSNYPAINSGDVKQLKIQIGSVEEQTAIAEILSDMDSEIQALEQRLAKTRQIKQGMMQQLLTGKVRLI